MLLKKKISPNKNAFEKKSFSQTKMLLENPNKNAFEHKIIPKQKHLEILSQTKMLLKRKCFPKQKFDVFKRNI